MKAAVIRIAKAGATLAAIAGGRSSHLE
jgi:hypothetical protein